MTDECMAAAGGTGRHLPVARASCLWRRGCREPTRPRIERRGMSILAVGNIARGATELVDEGW